MIKEIIAIMSYTMFEYIWILVHICIYIYIYIHMLYTIVGERERERMNETRLLVTEYPLVSSTLHINWDSHFLPCAVLPWSSYFFTSLRYLRSLFSEGVPAPQKPQVSITNGHCLHLHKTQATYQSFAKLQRSMEDHCFHPPWGRASLMSGGNLLAILAWDSVVVLQSLGCVSKKLYFPCKRGFVDCYWYSERESLKCWQHMELDTWTYQVD